MMNDPRPRPPVWPLKLLRFVVKDEYLEEIEGDMEEVFMENVERFSLPRARLIYAWEVLKLLRPVLLKNINPLPTSNPSAMYKNYFKVAYRNLVRKKGLRLHQRPWPGTGNRLLRSDLYVRAG